MRWPFGPPHLTLKPSKKKKTKKTKNKKNKNKKQKKQITNKEGLGPSEVAPKKKNKQKQQKKRKNKKKTQKYQKKSFSIISQFVFLGGGSKNCLFNNLAQKMRTPQNTIKIGVSAYFLKKNMRHETAIFGPKKTQILKFQLSFFAFFLFQQQKHQN